MCMSQPYAAVVQYQGNLLFDELLHHFTRVIEFAEVICKHGLLSELLNKGLEGGCNESCLATIPTTHLF